MQAWPDRILEWLKCAAPASRGAHAIQALQPLWGGYGQLFRAMMSDPQAKPLIVKAIQPPSQGVGLSHRRKLRSYEIERRWYGAYAARCDANCRVPIFVAEATFDDGTLLALEDLDAAGFPGRGPCSEPRTIEACLGWLANFHATFMGAAPEGLWPTGTYWHLATRPEELGAMRDQRLREAATAIDARLNGCRNLTVVHGDAKPANFCLNLAGNGVAAVDFQYTGGGCGVKDVVYFLDSVLDGSKRGTDPFALLDRYFSFLREALAAKHPEADVDAVEAEWRQLYPFAWADLYRFLSGWAPGLARPHPHASQMIEDALRRL